MPPFAPAFTITPRIASLLMRIEASRQAIDHLPITASVLASLRETARLYSTHYSTMIEGNQLAREQVAAVLERSGHFPGRERDEHEVLGYYSALKEVETLAAKRAPITERQIKLLHALAMAGGKRTSRPTPYRDGQNVIRDARTRRIVYLPPEAKDVAALMKSLVSWLADSNAEQVPCPLRAGIAHYQFATIHPYYDGNGRTARLLTTLIMHLGGFGMKGVFSLEEYYARDLPSYYAALTIGPSHNYYGGRAQADITPWLNYFCAGMTESFERVQAQAQGASQQGASDRSQQLRQLDARQRKVLTLFTRNIVITSRDISRLFVLSERRARDLLSQWVREGFLVVHSAARKNRTYGLSQRLLPLVDRR